MDFNLRFDNEPCLDVAILDDEVVEGRETFTVTLSTSHPDIQIHQDQIIINIIDTDAEVSLPAVLLVAEDEGTVQVCALFTYFNEFEFDFNVTLATSDGTGTLCVCSSCSCVYIMTSFHSYCWF